jgi:hypothetical protein
MIEHLPSLAPNPTRNARIIARCHDALDRRRANSAAVARYALERNALLGFGALYLSSLAISVIRILAVR